MDAETDVPIPHRELLDDTVVRDAADHEPADVGEPARPEVPDHGGVRSDHVERGGAGYNEMVIDARSWVDHLPATILAIFYVAGGDANQARGVRADFQREYALPEAQTPPVVRYDMSQLPTPFVLA